MTGKESTRSAEFEPSGCTPRCCLNLVSPMLNAGRFVSETQRRNLSSSMSWLNGGSIHLVLFQRHRSRALRSSIPDDLSTLPSNFLSPLIKDHSASVSIKISSLHSTVSPSHLLQFHLQGLILALPFLKKESMNISSSNVRTLFFSLRRADRPTLNDRCFRRAAMRR